MQQRNSKLLMVLILIVGIVARIAVSLHGYNYDVESYWLVGQIADNGGNAYAETHRYNYGPVWFGVLTTLYKATTSFPDHFVAYRISIALFLTAVDVGIALLLWKKFGKKVATLFFLNPISIIITGYHSQFDNLAILFGFASVLMLAKSEADQKRTWAGWAMLGLSLMTKHILFALPIWLAIKQKVLWKKIAVMIVPFGLFAVSFVPFWEAGSRGIIDNVLLYRSMNNAPFWTTVAPGVLQNNLPVFLLFIASLIVAGFAVRKVGIIKTFLIYLACLVLFSSSIANQYLAILVPFISVYFNIWLALLTIVSTLYLLIEPGAGMGITQLAFIPLKFVSLNIQIALLFIGMMWISPARKYVSRLGNWVKEEIDYQLASFTNKN